MSKKVEQLPPSLQSSEETPGVISETRHSFNKPGRPWLDLNAPPKEEGYISPAQEKERVVSQMMSIFLSKFY